MEAAIKAMINEHCPTRPVDRNEETAARLRQIVEDVSIKRDLQYDRNNNGQIGKYMRESLTSCCDFVKYQGDLRNVIASWDDNWEDSILIGGHYDGPTGSPGADDNGSALAVLIVLAEQLKEHKPKNVVIASFNGEEYGMLGSKDFAERHRVRKAVILEMVGYYSTESGSQSMPDGFPEIDCGDFLTIIGNHKSEDLGKSLIRQAGVSSLSLPLKELKLPFGLETKVDFLGTVSRSDHSSFWEHGVPAVMLTDTAEYRNSNYHQASDLPDTLDYHAMAEVVRLLKDWVLSQTSEETK